MTHILKSPLYYSSGSRITSKNMIMNSPLYLGLVLALVYQGQALGMQQLNVGENPVCDECINLITYLKQLLESASTPEEAEMELDSVACSQFGRLEGFCDKIIARFAPQVFDLIKSEDDPSTICLNIQMCRANSDFLSTQIPSPVTLGNNAPSKKECKNCKNFVRDLNKKREASITENVNALGTFCTRLPEGRVEQCKGAVEGLGQRLIQELESVDIQQICADMDMCPQ